MPTSLGSWFGRVGGVIRRSFVPLLYIQIGITIVSAVFVGILVWAFVSVLPIGESTSPGVSIGVAVGVFVLAFAVLLFGNALAQGASVFVVIQNAAGEPTDIGAALRFAARRILPLLGWGIVAAIMIIVGFLLFLIPGIYLLIVFYATLSGVVLVERRSIGRCFQLVNPRFWRTAGRLVLAFLISIVYFAIIAGIQALAGPESVTSTVLGWIASIPVQLGIVAIVVVTYAELRFHENPGVLTPALAAELRR